MKTSCSLFFSLALFFGLSGARAEDYPRETICNDGIDNDGDSLIDCADDDCKDSPYCQPDGGPENTEERCSDFIDNDGNGYTDCDDDECIRAGVKVCQGSWDLEQQGGSVAAPAAKLTTDEAVEKTGGRDWEDLIGTMGDIDGERTNELCSDGIDNDGDGYTDCEDFGCRFDPQVTVCRDDNKGMRFSVVSHVTQSYDIGEEQMDTRFSVLQLRAFGAIPFIQDSFFLVSVRAERSPRLTFAMFQIPLGQGHYLNVNSGGGGLSTALIRSASKQLLVDSPYYLYNAFEQGNGAAIEVGGRIDDKGMFDYRVFLAGGSGRSNGNVGGRYFTFDNFNYTWTAGAQLGMNLIGFISRWDSPRLYVPVPTALGLSVGFKYDQRAQERFPAANVNLTFRHRGFIGIAETYVKRELEFGSWQVAYNLSAGYLVIPKHLLLAADIGQYLPGDFDNPPDVLETDLRRQLEEFQWRVGLHWYFWRNVGVLSAIYSDRTTKPRGEAAPGAGANLHEQIFKLVGQYQF